MKKIVLALLPIILILIILITTYSLINKQNEVVSLENQLVDLKESIEELEDLKNKINFMLNPRIVTNLGSSDVRTDPYRLYIDGYVINCGFETAYNCSLKVTLFRNRLVVKEAVIDLLSIENGDFIRVMKDIHYNGDPLTHWTIDPAFD